MAKKMYYLKLNKEHALFNTLSYSKKLMAAGIPRKHAEAQVEILAEIIDDNLATQNDLKSLEYRLVIKLGLIAASSISLAVATVALL